MAYPSTLSTLSNPQPTDRLNSPSHSSLHQAENTAITEIETFVGTLASTAGSLVYDVRSPLSNGGGHVQTANKGGTGYTSYTKGDLLVAQSASVLAKLAVGADNTVLVADSAQATGVKWGTSPTLTVASFVSDGVWTKPAAATLTSKVFVEAWGAGGSGGSNTGSGVVGGGGGGAYINAWYPASVLSASVIVGVGVGGLGVGGVANGNQGGITVFDTVASLLTAYGGGGGASNNVTAGGGGGGGSFNSGSNAATTANGGGGGSVFGGLGGSGNVAGSVGGYIGAFGGGGGGGGGGGPPSSGGNAILAGGGGGGAGTTSVATGGLSKGGGNGSNGSILTAASTLSGFVPGGGSGGAIGAQVASGPGGNGKVIVTVFL